MKKMMTAALALTIAASTAGAAAAQSWGHPGAPKGGQDRYEQTRGGYDFNRDRRATRKFKAGSYKRPSGYKARNWRRGERLPASYRGRGYVVDHRAYGLQAPPRGYQYVRVDKDVVLTAVATGLIASIVFGMFQ